MNMYIAGEWVSADTMTPVISPFDGVTVGEVPAATPQQVETALAAAVEGARQMRALTGYDRQAILNRAAELVSEQIEDLAVTVSREMGKPIKEARGEVGRMPDLLRLCGFEGTQMRGETLPIDAHVGAAGKFGFTMRVPCGIVVAITPFNYPVLLVLHKLGPALAAGNAVILKPAGCTALTGLKLTEILLEAGLPPLALQCVTGSGGSVGTQLCADSRVRKISFTGSAPVGEQITKVAGIKKLSLELGSNAPMIVLPDADLEQVAQATVAGGYANAGQVCISTQRVLVHRSVYADFLDAVKAPVEGIVSGDPMDENTGLGPLVRESEAVRVDEWIQEAVAEGARLVTGGERDGARYAPTILADVDPKMRVSCEELFGPAIAVTAVDDIDAAIRLANDSKFGLGTGIFTRDIGNAMRYAKDAEFGNIMINWTPLWRADFQPYGGFKQSGIGKEGPRYAIEEMTESKTVVIHGLE